MSIDYEIGDLTKGWLGMGSIAKIQLLDRSSFPTAIYATNLRLYQADSLIGRIMTFFLAWFGNKTEVSHEGITYILSRNALNKFIVNQGKRLGIGPDFHYWIDRVNHQLSDNQIKTLVKKIQIEAKVISNIKQIQSLEINVKMKANGYYSCAVQSLTSVTKHVELSADDVAVLVDAFASRDGDNLNEEDIKGVSHGFLRTHKLDYEQVKQKFPLERSIAPNAIDAVLEKVSQIYLRP